MKCKIDYINRSLVVAEEFGLGTLYSWCAPYIYFFLSFIGLRKNLESQFIKACSGTWEISWKPLRGIYGDWFSNLAVKDKLLVCSGLQVELIVNYLDKLGVFFFSPTFADDDITTTIESMIMPVVDFILLLQIMILELEILVWEISTI